VRKSSFSQVLNEERTRKEAAKFELEKVMLMVDLWSLMMGTRNMKKFHHLANSSKNINFIG
jgi:hypothetical protein